MGSDSTVKPIASPAYQLIPKSYRGQHAAEWSW
jgi:putative transposon-encoded protein